MNSKCKYCGSDLNEKTLGIDKMFSKEEATRLFKVRKEREVCSECSMQMLMLNLF